MNSSRSLSGLVRKGLAQSRRFKVSASPLPPKRCYGPHEIIHSPQSWQWGACETMQVFSRPQPVFLNQKLSLFSSVTSPDLSQKESNTYSSTEGSLENKGEEIVEPVSKKQPDSVGKEEAVKTERPDPKKTAKINDSDSMNKGEEIVEPFSKKQPDSLGKEEAVKTERPDPKKTAKINDSDSESESDSDEEQELSKEDLIQLLEEKEELLKGKKKEIQSMQEKVLRSYAEVENVMDRTRRDAENSKKFAIQSFAKSLLDVADNLGRASSVAKESFSKLDASKDSNGAAALLKTLLEGVEMTEKQLSDVFKKYGVEKYDPINEQFDPHRHMAVFQLRDATKAAGNVGVVLKAGYMLHDRVIRPAEVGVVEAVHTEPAEV